MRAEMAKKGHKPEEAVAKLRQVDVLVSQGQSMGGGDPGDRGDGGHLLSLGSDAE